MFQAWITWPVEGDSIGITFKQSRLCESQSLVGHLLTFVLYIFVFLTQKAIETF